MTVSESDIIRRYELLFDKLERLSFHPPMLPGAIVSGHIQIWLSEREKILKELVQTKSQLPPMPPEKIIEYRKRLSELTEIINEYTELLTKLTKTVQTTLETVRQGKKQLRGYKSLNPSPDKSGMSWTR